MTDEVSRDESAAQKESIWSRMKAGLSKTNKVLGQGLADLLVGRKEIDDELFEDIETQLLSADIGVEATDTIVQALTDKVGREELMHADALYDALQDELRKLLQPVDKPLVIDRSKKPYVILVRSEEHTSELQSRPLPSFPTRRSSDLSKPSCYLPTLASRRPIPLCKHSLIRSAAKS